MGIYIYTLRKKSRTVNVDGEFRKVMTFDYAYKVSYSGETAGGDYGRRYRAMVTNAERLSDEAWEAAGRKPTLAVWGDELWLITRPLWEDVCDDPGVRIGKIQKVNGRWYCVAQETLASIAEAMLEQSA